MHDVLLKQLSLDGRDSTSSVPFWRTLSDQFCDCYPMGVSHVVMLLSIDTKELSIYEQPLLHRRYIAVVNDRVSNL